MIIIFFAAAEGVWSGLVSYCFFRFSGSWFQSRRTLSGQRSLLLQQQLHSVWQRVLEMLDWQGSEAWLHQNWGRFMLHTCTPSGFLFHLRMKFAGPCFQHQLYRPGLGFCVLMSSFCHLATHQVWYHWTTSPCFWAVKSSNCESRWGKQKGLHADANSSHLHVFFWRRRRTGFEWKNKKPISFCWLILPPFCWCRSGSILGASTWVWLPLLSWLVESSCFRSNLFETMRFGAIWFTPDKTLGYV